MRGHREAMDSLRGLDSMIAQVLKHVAPTKKKHHACLEDDVSSLPFEGGRASKKRKLLEDQKKHLMEEIRFQKEIGEDYHTLNAEYLVTCAELHNLIAHENTDT